MKRVEQAILKQAEIEWRRFPGLPGNHLALKKSGWHSWEYADTTTGLVEMRCEASSQTRFPKSVFYRAEAGKRLSYPVMSAVDDAGDVALKFAEPRRLEAGEIVICPDQPITSELLVMMATASPFLAFFFLRPSD